MSSPSKQIVRQKAASTFGGWLAWKEGVVKVDENLTLSAVFTVSQKSDVTLATSSYHILHKNHLTIQTTSQTTVQSDNLPFPIQTPFYVYHKKQREVMEILRNHLPIQGASRNDCCTCCERRRCHPPRQTVDRIQNSPVREVFVFL